MNPATVHRFRPAPSLAPQPHGISPPRSSLLTVMRPPAWIAGLLLALSLLAPTVRAGSRQAAARNVVAPDFQVAFAVEEYTATDVGAPALPGEHDPGGRGLGRDRRRQDHWRDRRSVPVRLARAGGQLRSRGAGNRRQRARSVCSRRADGTREPRAQRPLRRGIRFFGSTGLLLRVAHDGRFGFHDGRTTRRVPREPPVRLAAIAAERQHVDRLRQPGRPNLDATRLGHVPQSTRPSSPGLRRDWRQGNRDRHRARCMA